MTRSQRITPCLWFDSDAEAAAKLYTALFAGSSIGRIIRYGKEGYAHHRQPEGRVLTIEMDIAGTQLMALNGGPMFKLNPSLSLFVMLDTEAAVDKLWTGLADGGSTLMPLDAYPWSRRYGWVNDRFGVSWQIGIAAPADIKRTITPFAMFTPPRAGEAEAAIRHYTSIFLNSAIDRVLRHDGAGPTRPAAYSTARSGLMVSNSWPWTAPIRTRSPSTKRCHSSSLAPIRPRWISIGAPCSPMAAPKACAAG